MGEKNQNAGPDNTHAPRMPDRRYAYFRDDQLMFVVRHQETLSPEEQSRQYKQFTAAINEQLRLLYGEDGQPPPNEPSYETPPQEGAPQAASSQLGLPQLSRQQTPPQVSDTPQVISFPELTAEERAQVDELVKHENGRYLTLQEAERIKSAFSIAVYDLNNAPPDPGTLMTIVQDLHPQLMRRFREDPRFMLQGTLPNWLTSVASQSGGTGGPGGRPFPYIGNRRTAPYRFSLQKQLEEKGIYGDGTGVDVVILDTAPCAQDLVAAYKELADHPLVPTLLGPRGKLHLYPATYEDQLRMTCTSLNDYDYKMTDHGLFIAGIIHSIVPNAEIHLIEVLNPYGVGDFWSFTRGLMTIFEKIYKPRGKMVVNCSWMLEFPRDDLQARHKDIDGDPDARFAEIVRTFSAEDEKVSKILLLALEFLLNRLYALGKQAVAAAGNDGKKDDPRPVAARYPAALTRVAGVGSLPNSREKRANNKFMPSRYSNVSDAPPRNGIATFGGEEGEGKGVLGLYIGEFPCCCNVSKWAWWAGTSFATPILTAAIASVLSDPFENVSSTPIALNMLYEKPDVSVARQESETSGKRIIQQGQVRDEEDAFLVKQY